MVTDEDDSAVIRLALGRLFRVMSRPYEAGDDDELFRCRSLILDRVEAPVDRRPCWARDRLRGAQGD